MEPRVLLSAYGLSQVAHLGVNDNGSDPQSTLVADLNGNLYGTTSGGGTFGYGTVFEMSKGSNAITTLAVFNDADGADPSGAMAVDAAGNLYGTTYAGGAAGDGTVFEVASGSNAITTLIAFNGANGALPHAGLRMDAAGNLYGTTGQGGAEGDGTAFEIVSGSTSMTTLISFGANMNPGDGLTLDPAGNLYGTTVYGGAYNSGTVFEIAQRSRSVTTLVSFGQSGLQAYDRGSLTADASGDLYGTTYGGVPNTVFEIANGSGAITTLASFNSTGNYGPYGPLVLDPSGNLYGTASGVGPPEYGTVFEVAAGSTAVTTLVSFTGANGAHPVAGLTLDASGNLYGTTAIGGANGTGALIEIAQGSVTATVLASFDPATGTAPHGGLTLDASGNLYGTTAFGGAYDDGTVFEIASGSDAITTIASFDGSNGANPEAALTLDASGNLYGTTYNGGKSLAGTVSRSPRAPRPLRRLRRSAEPP